MTIIKEKLSDLKEKYEKAEKLVEEESKNDTEVEPYKSHYAAKDILIEIQNNLKNILFEFSNSDQDGDALVYKCILGYIYKDIGRICIWTDELSNGEQFLQKCLDTLEPIKLNAECVNAYLGALNQIGILWSNRQNPLKSKEYLKRAEELYKEFKGTGNIPLTIYDVFGTKHEVEVGKGMDVLEKIHTLTLYYLAQIYGSLEDLHGSAMYCHTTLQRQLDFNDYEAIDWSLNSATLSQYFFMNNRNSESRHHLAAAQYMLDKHESEMYTDQQNEEERGAILERFRHRSADIMRCWAKYGLNLLSESKNRLINDTGDDDEDSDKKGTNKVLGKYF